MKTFSISICIILAFFGSFCVRAQQNPDLVLSTKSMGVAPIHETPTSAAKWMQTPLNQQVYITVTNLYANASDYLEIDVNDQRVLFHGAGTDVYGNYIPTNYPPVAVSAVLRRIYSMNIECPNSGPNGSPFFQVGELDPNQFLPELTNSSPDPVSAYLWTNFTSTIQYALTNLGSTYQEQQTNLVMGVNQLLIGPSIYNPARFSGIDLGGDTTNLIAQSPQGQELAELNHLLLRDAYSAFNLSDGNSDYSGTAEVLFSVATPPQMQLTNASLPPVYSVLINGDSGGAGAFNLYKQPTGYSSITNFSFSITQNKFGHAGPGDGSDDATKAPGQATWLQMGPGCTKDTNSISLEWSVSLGRTFDGISAGQLAFREAGLTLDSFTPDAIFYNSVHTNLYANLVLVPSTIDTNVDGTTITNEFIPTNYYGSVILVTTNVEILATNSQGLIYTNYNSLLRQVKSCQTFVDILSPDTNHTVLDFYFPAQVGTNQDMTGLFTNIIGNPFVVWTIGNPNPGSTNSMVIYENRLGGGGVTNYVSETLSPASVNWTLTQGAGPDARIETRTVSFIGSPVTDRVESNTIRYATGAIPAYACLETYHFFPFGPELVESRLPNLAADLVTTYTYYTNGDATYDPMGYGYGQLDEIIYPDGYWEKRVYQDLDWDDFYSVGGGLYVYGEGLLYAVFRPYLDGQDGGATTPDSAWFDNTIYTQYGYPDVPTGGYDGIGNGETSYLLDGLHRNSIGASQGLEGDESFERPQQVPEGMCNMSWSGYAWDAAGCGALGGNCDGNHWASVLQYADQACLGLTGHDFCDCYMNGSPDTFYYYDHGIYNAISKTFTIDPSNHFYSVTNFPYKYPDHLTTRLDYAAIDWLGHYDDDLEGLYTTFTAGFTWHGDSTGSVDGHPFTNFVTEPYLEPFTNLVLLPGRTIKNQSMYQGGNLMEFDKYIYAGSGVWSKLFTLLYVNDSLGHATNVLRIDSSGQTRTIYTADYRGGYLNDQEFLHSETDEYGVKKTYTYDSLQRVIQTVKAGYGTQPDTTVQYVLDANGHETAMTQVSGSLAQGEFWNYDSAGRVTNHVSPDTIANSISYSADNRSVTTNLPGGISITRSKYLDRRDKSLTGNGVVQKFFTYTDESLIGSGSEIAYGSSFGDAFRVQRTSLGSPGSSRWSSTGLNGYNMENTFSIKPVGGGSTNTIWALSTFGGMTRGAVTIQFASDGFPMSFYYFDVYGANCMASTFTDDWEGNYDNNTDRRTWVDRSSVQLGTSWFRVTTNYVFSTDDCDLRTIQKIHLEQLSGFTGSQISAVIDCDADTNETVTTTYLDRGSNLLTKVISIPSTSSLDATQLFQNGLLISASTSSDPTPTRYLYDPLGRTNEIVSPLGFTEHVSYDPITGWMTSETDLTGKTTFYQYCNTNEANSGKVNCEINANGKKTFYAYTSQGQFLRTWGDVPYPAQYSYNLYGDLIELTTFRGGGSGWSNPTWPSGSTSGDNTFWSYDEASGVLLQKSDEQTNSVCYMYDQTTGRLHTQSLARLVTVTNSSDGAAVDEPITVTNAYDSFGDLTEQNYNDGTPAIRFNNYNRCGDPRENVDGSGTCDLVYDYAERICSSTYTTGSLAGISVSNHFNPYYGRDAVGVQGISSPLQEYFDYDAYGRLSRVSCGTNTASYSYAPDSDFLQLTTFKNGGNTVLTTTRTWDFGIRLCSIVNIANNRPVTSYAYQYDALNRRTLADLEDGSAWRYSYDDRDELTAACRFWPALDNNAVVSGQQFTYAYDNVGNLLTFGCGGDVNGLNLRTNIYTENGLNEFMGILTPGYVTIIGAALATNCVTVNGFTADRQGEYFQVPRRL